MDRSTSSFKSTTLGDLHPVWMMIPPLLPTHVHKIGVLLSLVLLGLYTLDPPWDHVHLGQIAYNWSGESSAANKHRCGDLQAVTAGLLEMVAVWLGVKSYTTDLLSRRGPAALHQWPATLGLAVIPDFLVLVSERPARWSLAHAGFQLSCWRESELQNEW